MSVTEARRERWEAVMKRAQLPTEMATYFTEASIEKVKVSRKQKMWTFYLRLETPVPPNVMFAMQKQVAEAFHPVVQVQFVVRYQQADLEQLIEMYWHWIRKKVAQNLSPSAAGWLSRAEWTMVDSTLTLSFPSRMMTQMAVAKQLDQVVSSLFQEVSGTRIQVKLQVDANSQAQEQFREQREQEEKKLIQEAMVSLEEAASAPDEGGAEEEGPVTIGYDFNDEPILIKEITDEERRVCIKGKVFKVEMRELRSGRTLLTFNVTDYSDSIAVKVFARDKEDAATLTRIKDGMWVALRGSVQYDTFARDLVVMANDIREVKPYKRMDTADEKRVELHLHTAMSAMDGVYDPGEMVKRAAEWGHPAVAITDHGVLQAYPDAFSAGKKHGIKILYGLEAFVVDDGVSVVMNEEKRLLKEDTYVVFDVETTGLSAMHDEIIELAAVKVENGAIVDRFESFVNPHRPLSATITELTSITDDMVKDAPDLDAVLPDYLNFIEGTVLVAHNARFDMGFLQAGAKKIGREPVKNPVIDTLELGRLLYPRLKNHRLNTLCKQFDIDLTQHHRAIYDAEATGYLLWKMLEDCVERELPRLDQLNQLTGERDVSRLRPFHGIVLVENLTGLKNLYKMVSESHLNYFHRTPRIPRSLLQKYREGLIVGSGCEKGELYEAALTKSPEEVEAIAEFYDYLEIQPIEVNRHLVEKELVENEERLRDANRLLVEIGEKLGKPVVATSNAHYLDAWDSPFRDILAFNQTGGFRNSGPLSPVHFRTTDEMLAEFSYLGEEKAIEVVVTNPRAIADRIEEMKPFPDDLHTPIIEGAEEELRQICYDTAREMYGEPLPTIVEERLEKELGSIIKHGFAVIYLISQKLVVKSLQDGYLVGSRGSVGSSFVATMSHITEVNPLPPHYVCPSCKHSQFIADGTVASGFDLPDKDCPECGSNMKKDGHDIPFETFLGFKGDKVPDIDLNFSGEYQPQAHKYTEELFGKDYVYRAGTISTVAQKTAFGYVKKFEEEKGQQWRSAEIDRMVEGCSGVKRTTGQHPGGQMVIPQNLEVFDFTPIQRPADDVKSETITTHFDYHAISGRLLKLDILGHDDPTVIRMLQDLTGVDPQSIPVDDPEVMKLFSGTESLGITPEELGTVTGTLGIPEFGTRFVRQMLEDTKPTTFSELVRISGLSHGTDVWLNNAQDLVRNGTAVLSEVISTRDDIMIYLIYKGMDPSIAFKLMEKVRKGKGLTEEEGELMRQHDVPQWYIDSCRKIKYMFPKAHAVAYVLMAVRIAWFKVYHPIEYYATYFTVRADDFDVELVLKGKDAVKKAIVEIEEKGVSASPKEKGLLTILESVREMLARGLTFQRVDLYRSDATHFKVEGDSLIPPFSSVSGIGTNAAKNIVVARQDGEFLSIEDLTKRARVTSAVVEVLKRLGCLDEMPESNQLTLF